MSRAVGRDLVEWLVARRWYAGKDHAPRLTEVGRWRRPDPRGEADVEILLLRDDAASPPVVYHVPLTLRRSPLAGAEEALVPGVGDGAREYAYDGPHDPAYVRALLDALSEPGTGSALLGASGQALLGSRVLSGQQSHTSVVCRVEGADPVLVKVFRTVVPGPNPDVELPAVLFAAGCRDVPRPRGSLSRVWDDSPGHLATAATFVTGAQDGWELAVAAAGEDEDFAAAAREIGKVTARLHRTLAAALGTSPATPADAERLTGRVRARLADASAAVPDVGAHRGAVEELLAGLDPSSWPSLHRVHGDLHLGQVLRAEDGCWLVVDFEGEPLRPLAERRRPDLPLVDVAGLLRSFDYAAGLVEASTTGVSRRRWASACRAAFLQGYGASGGSTPAGPALLRVLEVDKALYEVGYDARHRPGWVAVPLQALERLLVEGAS